MITASSSSAKRVPSQARESESQPTPHPLVTLFHRTTARTNLARHHVSQYTQSRAIRKQTTPKPACSERKRTRPLGTSSASLLGYESRRLLRLPCFLSTKHNAFCSPAARPLLQPSFSRPLDRSGPSSQGLSGARHVAGPELVNSI